MGLAIDFPTSPYEILLPAQRWFPGEDDLGIEDVYARLIPPLVNEVRTGVLKWRNQGYKGASDTTKALLNWWFETPHYTTGSDSLDIEFRYYFAQREAVESAIWLYEVQGAQDPYALLRFDASNQLTKGHFPETWPRYVMKMATGAGKTKVLSLLIAWAYFHKKYEKDSALSTNFLLIAPNIIVLERLREDFDGLRIFHADPILPENGWHGRSWSNDFQMTLHIQDDIGAVSAIGNLFLTNIHRVYEGSATPSLDDGDLTDFFLGKRPTGPTHAGQVDLTDVIRDVDDLVVLNDEAHHIHDPNSEWFKSIEKMESRLKQKGGGLAVQFDVTATPKTATGAIFPQTVADYPLVEAIRQNVVKTPVLPDEASRAKLQEGVSDDPVERYRDFIHLGYLEWKKTYDRLIPTGKKSILFVMASDTKECDAIAEHLEVSYPELDGAVLTIHTKKDGSISEADSNKTELEELRRASREIDSPDSPYKAIVSVLMLREGWDVQNVVSMVGLRPYTAESKILPEQTLGRGLRRMFRGDDSVTEFVSVVGTNAFMDFVENIKTEGVELSYVEMGEHTKPQAPLVIEVDRDNKEKDLERLDIELPILTPRVQREYKNLDDLDVSDLPEGGVAIKSFTKAEQREIVFRDLDTGEVTWATDLGQEVTPSPSAVVAYFVNRIIRSMRLVGGHDVLYVKVKAFIEERLFVEPVDIEDPNILRNLSEIEASRTIHETFVDAVNELTVVETGTSEVRNTIKLSKTRAFVTAKQEYVTPKKSIFNRVVGDSHLELRFAKFLDGCDDIISFAKNDPGMHFQIEYVKQDGAIGYYRPDFFVKQTYQSIWIVETKGLEDLDVAPKWDRLVKWCKDASAAGTGVAYRPLYVTQTVFDAGEWSSFGQLVGVCEDDRPAGLQLPIAEPVPEVEELAEVISFVTHLPKLTLEAAAGPFRPNEPVEHDEWVPVELAGGLKKGMFVVEVQGTSMEPRIPDGSLAVFQGDPDGGPLAGSRDRKIVLAQLVGYEDPEGAGSFAIKRFRSTKRIFDDGDWRHLEITLQSLNSDVPDIVVTEPEGISVIAEFVAVIE